MDKYRTVLKNQYFLTEYKDSIILTVTSKFSYNLAFNLISYYLPVFLDLIVQILYLIQMFIGLVNMLDISSEVKTVACAGKLTLFDFKIKKQYCIIIIVKGKTNDIVLTKRAISYLDVMKTNN